MASRNKRILALLTLVLFSSLLVVAAVPATHAQDDGPRLERGINLAGDFEVTPRGSWGTPIQESFFPLVAAQGFDHVRIPIRWSSYTGGGPNYTINENFFREVDRLVDLAQANDLGIVLDVHFFEELEADPVGQRDRFLAIWDQIAVRYQNRPASVVFELLNEPTGAFNDQPEVWNQLAAEATAVIRRTNPTRTLIIGPVNWNHASFLGALELPDDPNIVATIHTYDPFDFTHQGATFVDPIPPTGVVWRANEFGLALDWLDRSWNIRTASGANNLSVTFDQEWAALAMASEQAANANRLEISLDRSFSGLVVCNFDTDDPVTLDLNVGASGDAAVGLSPCGTIQSLAVQSPNAGVTIGVERLAVCGASCSEVVVTNAEGIDDLITGAATWARQRGAGLYIGEFGTLSTEADPTDPQSRREWTQAVRTSAERNGAGWAYFELNSDFGAYNLATGQWRPEVTEALFGEGGSGYVASANSIEDILAAVDYTAADADILRLYPAFLNREPDVGGAKYWIARTRAGATYDDVALAFAQSEEFRLHFGATLSNEAYLTLVYNSTLGRAPDPQGLSFWLAKMSEGLTRPGVVRWFAASAEFINNYPYAPI